MFHLFHTKSKPHLPLRIRTAPSHSNALSEIFLDRYQPAVSYAPPPTTPDWTWRVGLPASGLTKLCMARVPECIRLVSLRKRACPHFFINSRLKDKTELEKEQAARPKKMVAAPRTGLPQREDKTQVNQSVKQRSIQSRKDHSVTDSWEIHKHIMNRLAATRGKLEL